MIQWNALTSEQRDQLVAEKIMGWSPESRCEITEEDREIIWGDDLAQCKRCGHINWDDRMQTHATEILPYSTSLDAAWVVLRHMLTWEINGTYSTASTSLMKWFLHNADLLATVTAEETADALCVAALRAAGIEIEK